MAAENPPTRHDREPAPDNRIDTDEYADRWALEAFDVGRPGSVADAVRDTMRELTEQLLASFDREPFSGEPARLVGRRMVAELPANTGVLEATIRLLCNDFRSILRPNEDPDATARIAAAAGALAAGYSEALRDHGTAEREFTTLAVVDELDRAEAALQASLRRFRTVFESAAIGIVIANLDGRLEQTNPALSRILHYTAEEFRERPLASFVHPEDLPVVRAEYERLIEGQIEWYRAEIRLIRRDGDPVWVQITASLVRDAEDRPAYWITMVENLTDTKMLVRSLTHQSLHDELTGLPNRAQFLRRLETILAPPERPARIALWYLDLDGFKVVNDSLGHVTGDAVIQTIAQRLRSALDEDMVVARVGGDEFAGIVEDASCGSELELILNRILDEIGRTIYRGPHEISMSASIGVVDQDTEGLAAAELLRAANLTLHWAKSDGKGHWTPYDEERNRRDRARFRLAVELPSALRDGQFELSVQPVLRLADETPIALNALVHWQHPDRGLLEGADFLDVAAETGLTVPLGRWTLQEACREAGRTRRAGTGDRSDIAVSVRLSSRQAKNQNLVRDVLDAIKDGGVPASALHLWLDAADLLGAANEDVREAMGVITELGVGLVVANFGLPPLPTAAFGALPIAAVELAPGYLPARTVRDAPQGEEWFARLVAAAHHYTATVIVGGVATSEDAELLRRVGSDAAYGPYVNALVSADGTAGTGT